MNFEFSSEQLQLRETARRFLSDRCPPAAVRAVMDGGNGLSFDRSLWNGLAEMGLPGAAIPENYGGLGLGYLELCVIAEELGRALAPVPFSSSIYLAAELLLAAGSEEQKAQWLPKLASGEALGTLAIAEVAGVVTPAAIAATVQSGLLSGTKLAVADGDVADIAIVVARSAGGLALLLADLNQPAVTRQRVETIDPSRGHANLTFTNAVAQPLGAAVDLNGTATWSLLESVLDKAAILFAFEQLGGADRALETARDYSLERMAFGRPIGSFQAIKHMLADMYVSATLARSNCYYGAWALASNAPELPVAAATARVAATQAYQHCARNALQIHGGMGFTWEADCHLYYRRSNLLALALGGVSQWEDQLIERLTTDLVSTPAVHSTGAQPTMNFDDTPEEAAFRAEVRAWMDANAPHHLEPELLAARGSGLNLIASENPLVAAKAWQKKKADAGYSCPTWPKEYGGGGLTPMQKVILQQEEGLFTQLHGVFSIGHGMCGPTLMHWADKQHQQQRIPPMVSGEEIWCQLFSEPSAGSDVAGLRTRAERANDGSGDWIINGQKIWTSAAHHADYGLLIARTDPTVAKHKGLTMFFLDMKSSGVEVRPIRQANGGSGFNEVFFTDVRIPDSQRLGAVGQGWEVSLTTLMNERMSIGASVSTGFEQIFDLANSMETATGKLIDDRAVRSKLANWAVRSNGLKYTSMRAISAISRGEIPGPENSIGKLVAGAMKQEIAMFALDLQGQAGVLIDPALATAAGSFQATLLRSPAMRIEGGTDEILRNVIAERVLRLPGDIRVDKAIPFNQIPTSGRRS